ncbi:MAG TPA: hypothetical protein VF629_18835 [Hymenobacter sp.]|jgi:hypothetical protein|uniref:hypothetical protein n=1 Tax=Hymenobacter sp. TaxID=1898978 RepID=UPI002EDA409E
MSTQLLLASEVLDVHYDLDNAWLYLDWKGPQELELVQAACQHLTEFIKQTGARKALNDNTHITQTSWELVKWVAYEYLPEAGRLGVEQVAWVQSPLPGCRSRLDLMDDFVSDKPQVAIFQDMAAAYEWLSSASVPAHH